MKNQNEQRAHAKWEIVMGTVFGWFFTAVGAACFTAVFMGHTYHINTTLMCVFIATVCFHEAKKAKKGL